MIILPIGHEQDTVRRLPWMTFSILALCFVLHIFVNITVNNLTQELGLSARELIEYYISHPYLEFDPELKKLLFAGADQDRVDQYLSLYAESGSRPGAAIIDSEQDHFDQLARGFLTAMQRLPYRKWGYIPSDSSFLALITYMFIHGGWFHLLGNLLFLYLTGPFIEDLWGRPVFIAFYVIVGMLAAYGYGLHYPDSTGPLVGASGAIAGVMGAFLGKYWKIKINFFYFFFPFFRGTFQAPAWLMLPLWLGLEILNARIMDSISSTGGSVAHWAHIWGFGLGLTFALAMNFFKVEEKYIHPKIESRMLAKDGGFDIVAHAIRQKNLGMIDNAYAVLLEEAQKNPSCTEVVETLWEFGNEMGSPDQAKEFYVKLIEKEIRQGQLSGALDHFINLKQKMPAVSLSPDYKIELIKHLIDQQDMGRAREYADELIQEIDLRTPPMVLQAFAGVAEKLSSALALRIIEMCLKHPEIPCEQKDRLQNQLLALGPATWV